MFLSLKGPVALEAGGALEQVVIDYGSARARFKDIRAFRLDPDTGPYLIVGRFAGVSGPKARWGATLSDTGGGDASDVTWDRAYGARGTYPTAADALVAAKCAAEWDRWKASLPSVWEREQADRVQDWFSRWSWARSRLGADVERPPSLDRVLDAMRQGLEGNPRLWLDNLPMSYVDKLFAQLIRCRYDHPSKYVALGRALDAVGWPRGEAPIPGERPLTMAEQKAHRAKKKAKKKPKKKPRAVAPRRPPQDPLPLERQFGYCKRCHVCLAYDADRGCCTVCARPLTRLNPRRSRTGRRKRNPDGCYVQTDNFDLQLHMIQGEWKGLKPVRLQPGGVGFGAGSGFGNKPAGAFWTSTLGEHEGSPTSDWDAWVQGNMPGWREGTAAILAVDPEARVLTLRTMKDYRAFAERYARPGGRGPLGMLLTFDWDAVARDYDGLHVECRVAVGHDALYGWDAESTAWFNTDHLHEVEVVKLDAMDPDDDDDGGPHENPGMRRFKDPGAATRHADRAARRSDQPHYVYMLSSNPRYAVLSEGHPVQYGIEQGGLDMGSTRLIHTAIPAPVPNPRRKRRKKKATSSRESRRARLRRLLRI